MGIVLSLYAAVQVLELICWQTLIWRQRQFVIYLIFGLVIIAAAVAIDYSPSVFTVFLGLISLYRLVNLARVMLGRMQSDYLRRATWRTSFWLAIYGVVAYVLYWAFGVFSISAANFWLAILLLQLALALFLLIITLKHSRVMRPPEVTNWLADRDLPTLTVAIPARNETQDLEEELMTLTASKYPKLEIIVLDDCSSTRRTPEIIRQFAHDGVKFIKGEKPTKSGWLPKNLVYQRLLDEANGELIMFCGADVRFKADSLNRIVMLMLDKKKSMISFMPRNVLPRFSQLDASLIQPMRYAWEVSLPRKLFRRPPVLSTCWVAKRELLLSSGGFSAVSRSIVPESYFARQAVRHDGYSFRYSTEMLGLTSLKDVNDQRDTATRTKYPQLHRRPEFVFLLTLVELAGMVAPFVFLVVSAAIGLYLPIVISAAACFALIVWFLVVCSLTYRQPDVRSLLSTPFAVLYDAVLLNYSMLKYEFSVVLWKGRDVCVPVMRVETRLPAAKAKPGKAGL